MRFSRNYIFQIGRLFLSETTWQVDFEFCTHIKNISSCFLILLLCYIILMSYRVFLDALPFYLLFFCKIIIVFRTITKLIKNKTSCGYSFQMSRTLEISTSDRTNVPRRDLYDHLQLIQFKTDYFINIIKRV